MRRYMPKIVDFLYYRLIDVTTIKELVSRWYPNNEQAKFSKKDTHPKFSKKDTHRAFEDIYESIVELKH